MNSYRRIVQFNMLFSFTYVDLKTNQIFIGLKDLLKTTIDESLKLRKNVDSLNVEIKVLINTMLNLVKKYSRFRRNI